MTILHGSSIVCSSKEDDTWSGDVDKDELSYNFFGVMVFCFSPLFVLTIIFERNSWKSFRIQVRIILMMMIFVLFRKFDVVNRYIFIRGMGSVFNLFPVERSCHVGKGIDLDRTESESLSSDWQKVAHDFRSAFEVELKDNIGDDR